MRETCLKTTKNVIGEWMPQYRTSSSRRHKLISNEHRILTFEAAFGTEKALMFLHAEAMETLRYISGLMLPLVVVG